MNHFELLEKISNQKISEDKKRKGFILSIIETTKDILISKGMVSEAEYNKYYDENLRRNFAIKQINFTHPPPYKFFRRGRISR